MLIEAWLEENWFDIHIAPSKEEMLVLFWPLIVQLNKNKSLSKIKPANMLFEFAMKWLAGNSYKNLLIFLKQSQAFIRRDHKKESLKWIMFLILPMRRFLLIQCLFWVR
ncbi:MAG: hypothetical protein V4629_02280 [Pseudomonadota bacterium]